MMTSPVGAVLTLSQKELIDEENDGIYDEDTDEDRCSLQDTDTDNPTSSKSASYLLYKYYDISQSKTDTPHTSSKSRIEIQNSQQQRQSSPIHNTSSTIPERIPIEQQPNQVSTCTICDEEYPTSEFTKLQCGHEFCRECLKSHFRIQIESGITENKCPEIGCKRDADLETLEGLLDTNLLTKKEKFRENHQQAADPTTRYCPIPTCSAPISWTGKKEDGPDYKKCSCSCGNNFCVNCGEEWSLHGESFSCRAASRASKRRSVLEHKQDQAAETWKKKNTKGCPKCGVNIQKIQGCDWMLCPQCANQFCWKCLDPHDHNLATHKHGPHGRSRRVAKKVAIGTGVTVAVIVLAIPALLVAGPLAINNRVRHGYWL